MAEFKVEMPLDNLEMVEWVDEGLPAIALVNRNLASFKEKNVFAWHLSIIIDLDDLDVREMPTVDELKTLDPFVKRIDDNVRKGTNALYLANVTKRGTRQLIYRVYDPVVADEFFQAMIAAEDHTRPFDYRIEQDSMWKQAEFFLKPFKEKN
jgi:hypothetical protein